jgi:hypothetical protein
MKMIHIVGVDWDSVFCVYMMTVHPSQSYFLGVIKMLSKLMGSQFLDKSMQLVSLGNPQPIKMAEEEPVEVEYRTAYRILSA